jgi:hypothetical protein
LEVEMKVRTVNPVGSLALGLVLAGFAALSMAPAPAWADPPAPASTATPAVAPSAPSPPTALEPPPPDPSVKRSTVAFAAAGVAAVGVGVATVFGVLALNNKHAYEKDPTFANTDNGNNDAAYADGGIVLAVAAGITSLVLFLTSDPADARPAGSIPQARSATRSPASPFVLRF